MNLLGFSLVALATFMTAADARDTDKFTPEFLQMLQSVLARLKVNKADLTKIAEPSGLDAEVIKASSTTAAPTPPPAPADSGDTYCEKQTPVTFKSYCKDTRMTPGVYVDPWDPYCGYIVCDEMGQSTRHRCEQGSWTGFKATSHGRQAMCRKPLKLAKDGYCTMATFSARLCRNAERVTDYNEVKTEMTA